MHSLARLIALLAAFAVAAGAFAQARNIPGEAKRGEMRHLRDMVVEINGRQQRLAPGAQIRDASNLIVVPTAVPAGAPIKYLVNTEGLVRQVWILTPQEAAKR